MTFTEQLINFSYLIIGWGVTLLTVTALVKHYTVFK